MTDRVAIEVVVPGEEIFGVSVEVKRVTLNSLSFDSLAVRRLYFNAIAVACDLAQLLRRAASRKDSNGDPAPIKVVFSTHHALFFNVMCNEIRRSKDDGPKVTHKLYFLHRPGAEGEVVMATDCGARGHGFLRIQSVELRLCVVWKRGKVRLNEIANPQPTRCAEAHRLASHLSGEPFSLPVDQ